MVQQGSWPCRKILFVPSARDEEERRWVLGAVNLFWLYRGYYTVVRRYDSILFSSGKAILLE